MSLRSFDKIVCMWKHPKLNITKYEIVAPDSSNCMRQVILRFEKCDFSLLQHFENNRFGCLGHWALLNWLLPSFKLAFAWLAFDSVSKRFKASAVCLPIALSISSSYFSVMFFMGLSTLCNLSMSKLSNRENLNFLR